MVQLVSRRPELQCVPEDGSSKLEGAAAKHIQMTVSTISCYYIYVCVNNSQAINKHVCMWNINVKKKSFFD